MHTRFTRYLILFLAVLGFLGQGLAGLPLRSSLPEGFYTFRIPALEASTGREVSNMAETYFSITTPLPPVINIPVNGTVLNASTGLLMTSIAYYSFSGIYKYAFSTDL